MSFIGVVALLLAIGVVSQYFNREVKNSVFQESQKAIHRLEISNEIGFSLYQSVIHLQYFLEYHYQQSVHKDLSDSSIPTEKAQQKIKVALGQLKGNLAATDMLLETNSTDSINIHHQSIKKIVNQLKKSYALYASLIKQLLILTNKSNDDAREFFTTTIEPFFRTNLLPQVKKFQAQIQDNLNKQFVLTNRRMNKTSNILFFATAFAVLVALALAMFLYHSITDPLQKLASATQEIGRGNLEKRIDTRNDDEIGQLGEAFNRMAENLSKITFSKNYVDDIIESMGDVLLVTDNDWRIQKVNSAITDLLGYSNDELIGQPMALILKEDDIRSLMELKDDEKLKRLETECMTEAGNGVPVSLSKNLIHDGEGQRQGVVWVISDISRRKKAEQTIKKSLEEKEVLLAEIHHRVKNNLAVISGLLQMQIWEADDEKVEEVLKDSQLRVQSIALVHEKLYQSENLSSIKFNRYIDSLLSVIKETYTHDALNIQFQKHLHNLELNIKQAISCSLLLNELVVNAYKHAFKLSSKGEIIVKLWQDESMVYLVVQDNGSGLPDDFTISSRKSLGLSLIDTMVQQLNGEMEIYNDGGAVFKIAFKREEATAG